MRNSDTNTCQYRKPNPPDCPNNLFWENKNYDLTVFRFGWNYLGDGQIPGRSFLWQRKWSRVHPPSFTFN